MCIYVSIPANHFINAVSFIVGTRKNNTNDTKQVGWRKCGEGEESFLEDWSFNGMSPRLGVFYAYL